MGLYRVYRNQWRVSIIETGYIKSSHFILLIFLKCMYRGCKFCSIHVKWRLYFILTSVCHCPSKILYQSTHILFGRKMLELVLVCSLKSNHEQLPRCKNHVVTKHIKLQVTKRHRRCVFWMIIGAKIKSLEKGSN